MALDQVLGDQHGSGSQLSIASPRDRMLIIDAVTLVTRGEQTGSSIDGTRRRIMLDRPRFARESRRRHDVDPSDAQ